MNTNFKNVANVAAELAREPSVAEAVSNEITCNTIVLALLQMRIAKGKTQEEVALAMGCDPSTISRIESASDRKLKWMDIVGYLHAVGGQMSLMFDDESLPAASRIKQCVYKIDEDLKKLADLANQVGDGDDLTLEINRFYRQVLFNFLKRYSKNQERLPQTIRVPSRSSLPGGVPEEPDSEESAPPRRHPRIAPAGVSE